MNGEVTVQPKLPIVEGEPLLNPATVALSPTEGYARWAPFYDHAPNPLLAREERHLLPLLVGLHGKRILDLACGTGRWLERFVVHGLQTGVGIDCSAAMLRIAGKKNTITGRVAQAYCENLPFLSAAFDLAICSFAVGHIRDLPSIVRELSRVTKPGADVFVSDLHPEAYARGWKAGFRDGSSAVQIEVFPRPAEEIVRSFYANGFECLTHLPLCLGKPEKHIFVEAGKEQSFAESCRFPAILVCHFKRISSAIAPGMKS